MSTLNPRMAPLSSDALTGVSSTVATGPRLLLPLPPPQPKKASVASSMATNPRREAGCRGDIEDKDRSERKNRMHPPRRFAGDGTIRLAQLGHRGAEVGKHQV